jgi:hypothetical protein
MAEIEVEFYQCGRGHGDFRGPTLEDLILLQRAVEVDLDFHDQDRKPGNRFGA